MHKAILLDLGKVVIHFDFRIAYRALEKLCPYSAAEIPKRLGSTDLVQRFETGLIEPHAFVAETSRLLDLNVTYEEYRRLFGSIFTNALIPEEMLEALARRYRLIMVSNTNALHFDVLGETYGHLLRHFHHRVLSYQVRAMKPEAEIFHAAVTAAGCRAEDCFYADDIATFVEAARAMGIDAVQFESCAQIEREMRARGIDW
jgi:putative hydrolase of the HAD superfamily